MPAATKTTCWVARFESVNYRARRLPQRAPDRHARGRVPTVRGPADQRPQEGREPPGGAGGQPPLGHGPAAARGLGQRHARRRLVELRRPAARGLPAQGRPRGHLELRGPADPPLPRLRRQRAGPGHAPQRGREEAQGRLPRLRGRPGRPLPAGHDPGARHPPGVGQGDDRQPAPVGAGRPSALPREGLSERQRPHRGGLRRAHRDPLDQGEERPPDPERDPHHAARRQRARGGARHRRRAHQRPGAGAVQPAPAGRRHAHALALPAQPALPRAGGPRRDHGLGRDPHVPHERRGAAAQVGEGQGAHRHPGDDPARPEPPVGADLVDRQREPLEARLRPDPLHRGGPHAGQPDGPHAPTGVRHRGLSLHPEDPPVQVHHRARDQRLLRLVPGAQRPARGPQRPRPLPRPDACVLSAPGAVRDRVRGGVQPPRRGRREGHLRVPGRLAGVPEQRLRHEAVPERRDRVDPARLQGASRLGRRQPRLGRALQPEGPDWTRTAIRSRPIRCSSASTRTCSGPAPPASRPRTRAFRQRAGRRLPRARRGRCARGRPRRTS